MGSPEPDASHGHDAATRSGKWWGEKEELQPDLDRQMWTRQQSQEVTQGYGAGGERTEELQNVIKTF